MYPESLCRRRLASIEMALDKLDENALAMLAPRLTAVDDWAWRQVESGAPS